MFLRLDRAESFEGISVDLKTTIKNQVEHCDWGIFKEYQTQAPLGAASMPMDGPNKTPFCIKAQLRVMLRFTLERCLAGTQVYSQGMGLEIRGVI